MKKKLFAIAATMLCMVMLLSSCSLFTSNIPFKKFVNQDYQPKVYPSPTSLKKLDFDGDFPKSGDIYNDDYDVSRYRGNLIVLVGGKAETGTRTVTTVYNTATDQIIWQGKDSQTRTDDGIVRVEYTAKSQALFVEDRYVSLAIVETQTTTESTTNGTKTVCNITVWSEDGNQVVELKNVSKTKVNESIWVRADLFSIQHKVYRVFKDGSVEFAFDWSDAKETPYILEKVGDFYVASSNIQGQVFIYDSKLNLTATYVVPKYGEKNPMEMGFHAFILANGNVLVQYVVLQDDSEKKHTYFLDGEKYKLCSLLIEAKNGKIKELDLDYQISVVRNGFAAEKNGISEKIENMAIAYPIKDQQIDRSKLAAKIISIKNNGRVAGVLDIPITGVVLTDGFWGIAQNRWEFSTIDGRKLIVDETGDVIGEDFDILQLDSAYFVIDDRIYDWNLDVKYDLTKENGSMISVLNHSVLFKNQKGETKLYVNGEAKTLINEAESKEGKRTVRTLCRGAYLIIDTTSSQTKYEVYNDLGELLGTITDNVSVPEYCKMDESGVILLSAQVDYRTVKYYRIG